MRPPPCEWRQVANDGESTPWRPFDWNRQPWPPYVSAAMCRHIGTLLAGGITFWRIDAWTTQELRAAR